MSLKDKEYIQKHMDEKNVNIITNGNDRQIALAIKGKKKLLKFLEESNINDESRVAIGMSLIYDILGKDQKERMISYLQYVINDLKKRVEMER